MYITNVPDQFDSAEATSQHPLRRRLDLAEKVGPQPRLVEAPLKATYPGEQAGY